MDASGAGDCCAAESTDKQSAAESTKKMRFTGISLGKVPCRKNSNTMRAECQEKERRRRGPGAKEERACGSAADPRLQEVDYRVLPGDDLGLPNQCDHQEAHGKDADGDRQTHLSFRSR